MSEFNVLEEAERIVSGVRRKEYGDVSLNFDVIAGLWSEYLGMPREITKLDVAHMMILLKIARGKNTYHRDSIVDICGYARCAEMIYGYDDDE